MSESNLAVIERRPEPQTCSVFLNIKAFADGQRMAELLSKSKLIPANFQGNLPDCVIALELAQRIGCSPLAVMQATYIVGGRPGYSAQFVIALINSCGKFSPLRFEIAGDGDERQCIAWAIERETGERLEGAPVSIAMAKAEGWYSKNGSKWKTMPEQMLRYRAAAFFGRIYAPDLLQGMRTVEELRDEGERIDKEERKTAVKTRLADRFYKEPAETIEAAGEVIDHEPEKPDVEKKPEKKPEQEQKDQPGEIDQAGYNAEIAKINKLSGTVAIDKWRMNNNARLESTYSIATLNAINEHLSDVYQIFRGEEEEAERESQAQ